jgi:uncharacterized protein (TIGR03437 family)
MLGTGYGLSKRNACYSRGMSARAVVLALTTAVCLTAQTIPVITPGGVVNAASNARAGEPGHAVAPGSLISIYGRFLAALTEIARSIPLPIQLSDATVKVVETNTPIPLQFVSPDQINAQLPWDALAFVPPGTTEATVTIIVERPFLPSDRVSVRVAPVSPGIFALGNLAVAVNASDGTLAQPNGSVPGLNTHGAARGSAIILYANGLGEVDKPVASGSLGSEPIINTKTRPTVLIGGVEAPVLFSGLAPQFVGVNQVNILIPDNAPAGDAIPVQIRMNGITTTERTTVAIAP